MTLLIWLSDRPSITHPSPPCYHMLVMSLCKSFKLYLKSQNQIVVFFWVTQLIHCGIVMQLEGAEKASRFLMCVMSEVRNGVVDWWTAGCLRNITLKFTINNIKAVHIDLSYVFFHFKWIITQWHICIALYRFFGALQASYCGDAFRAPIFSAMTFLINSDMYCLLHYLD